MKSAFMVSIYLAVKSILREEDIGKDRGTVIQERPNRRPYQRPERQN